MSSLISASRQSAVLNKINNHGSLASLGKENYPNAGRKLFGTGFEARLKARAETTQTLVDAGSAGCGHSQAFWTQSERLLHINCRSFPGESLHSTLNPSERSLAHRQYNSSDIYQQNGGHQVPHSVKSCLQTVVLVSSTPKQYNGATYSRNPKPPGQPGVAYCCRPL